MSKPHGMLNIFLQQIKQFLKYEMLDIKASDKFIKFRWNKDAMAQRVSIFIGIV